MDKDNKELQKIIRYNIFTLFEIETLPEAEQEEAIARIGKIVFQQVLLRVLPLMSKEEIAEYEALMKKGFEAEELFQFFFDKIPNFLQIATEESEKLRIEAGKMFNKKIE